ncbi:MAG TPA: histidine kinase [Flavobacteriaceae bacterium]|nr:histidine kinase [Flavobacteriaceae bacterium]
MISTVLTLLQEVNPPISTSAERYLLIYMVSILIILCGLIVVFFVVFQKRKNKLIMEKIRQQQQFEEEISNTQVEIQEQTLKNIGQELHDNIGQLLSVANMQLSILNTQVPEDIKESFTETKNVIRDSLGEVRALSKSLNSEVIANRGFQLSVQNEIERLNKLKLLNAQLIIEGNPENFKNSKDSIILFRILQEFLSNTIKYAKASNVSINLNYKQDSLEIKAEDNGVGFNETEIEKGAGLINMKSRAALIGVNFKLSSQVGKGTALHLVYPFRAETKFTL